MTVERCGECGFDGGEWTDATATDALGALSGRWAQALTGLDEADLSRRPLPEMWSIAEYADHVREVLFGMRFVLDSALADPGVDLGEAPEPRFDPVARGVDVDAALVGLEREALALRDRLAGLSEDGWTATARVGADELDGHWIVRHAVHDATHHLLDVQRLRDAL